MWKYTEIGAVLLLMSNAFLKGKNYQTADFTSTSRFGVSRTCEKGYGKLTLSFKHKGLITLVQEHAVNCPNHLCLVV